LCTCVVAPVQSRGLNWVSWYRAALVAGGRNAVGPNRCITSSAGLSGKWNHQRREKRRIPFRRLKRLGGRVASSEMQKSSHFNVASWYPTT